MKRANICPLLLLLACAASPIASFADAGQAPPQDLSQIKTLDEVIVSGKLTTLSGVHNAMVQAEDRFYARFNELVRKSNRELEIRCRNQAPTGSNIKRRVCVTAMAEDMSREQAMMFMSGQPGSIGALSAGAVQRTTLGVLRERTVELLQTDQDLRRALLEHARLQQIYEAMRKEKHEDHIFVWD